MSKAFRNIGLLLATGCGVLISVSAFQPELEKDKALKEGRNLSEFQSQHAGDGVEVGAKRNRDTVISDQIREDFREAGKEWKQEGGFGWGIRKALMGGSKPKEDGDTPAKDGGKGNGQKG